MSTNINDPSACLSKVNKQTNGLPALVVPGIHLIIVIGIASGNERVQRDRGTHTSIIVEEGQSVAVTTVVLRGVAGYRTDRARELRRPALPGQLKVDPGFLKSATSTRGCIGFIKSREGFPELGKAMRIGTSLAQDQKRTGGHDQQRGTLHASQVARKPVQGEEVSCNTCNMSVTLITHG